MYMCESRGRIGKLVVVRGKPCPSLQSPTSVMRSGAITCKNTRQDFKTSWLPCRVCSIGGSWRGLFLGNTRHRRRGASTWDDYLAFLCAAIECQYPWIRQSRLRLRLTRPSRFVKGVRSTVDVGHEVESLKLASWAGKIRGDSIGYRSS